MSKEKTNVKRIHLTLAPATVDKLDRMIAAGVAKDRSDAVGTCVREFRISKEEENKVQPWFF